MEHSWALLAKCREQLILSRTPADSAVPAKPPQKPCKTTAKTHSNQFANSLQNVASKSFSVEPLQIPQNPRKTPATPPQNPCKTPSNQFAGIDGVLLFETMGFAGSSFLCSAPLCSACAVLACALLAYAVLAVLACAVLTCAVVGCEGLIPPCLSLGFSHTIPLHTHVFATCTMHSQGVSQALSLNIPRGFR